MWTVFTQGVRRQREAEDGACMARSASQLEKIQDMEPTSMKATVIRKHQAGAAVRERRAAGIRKAAALAAAMERKEKVLRKRQPELQQPDYYSELWQEEPWQASITWLERAAGQRTQR